MQNMTSTGTTGNYNVNTLVLFFSSNNFVEKFKHFWENLKVTKWFLYSRNIKKWWVEAKYEIKRFLSKMGKSNSVFERRDTNMMKHTLDVLLNIMTQYPENKSCVKQYFDYKQKVNAKQMKLAKEKILKQNADKYFFGDRPTKEFFEVFKRKTDPGSKTIFEMKDENGIRKYDSYEILDIG